jgi:myo-inositol catabolism protein IolC
LVDSAVVSFFVFLEAVCASAVDATLSVTSATRAKATDKKMFRIIKGVYDYGLRQWINLSGRRASRTTDEFSNT